ncbi:MAG: hypothetical protein GY862_07970 [Gammaproteobacteria bacterium]|nr:hypothetical protein [Gammaproteobacteria bacterium]
MAFQVAQLIYANVEKQHSPKNIGGYQTLFYSHDHLNADEISQIEQRLLYYPGFGDPVKKIYFTLDSGKPVLARIVSLPEADSRGRKGRYLGHALIFEKGAASRIEPLNILRGFPFIDTVEQALAQGEFSSGQIALARVETSAPRQAEAFAAWHKTALAQITLYALRAIELAKEKRALAFVGTPAEMEAALEPVLRLVPAGLCNLCSFDSFFYNGNFVAVYFWAVGLPEPPPGGRFIVIDAARRAFLNDGDASLSPNTALERWAISRILADQAVQAAQDMEIAWKLCRWLEGEIAPALLPESVQDTLLREIAETSPKLLEERTYVRLTETLPEDLAREIAPRLNLAALTPARYAELRLGFALQPLLDLLFEHCIRPSGGKPAKPWLATLSETAGQAPHTGLKLLLAGWRKDWPALLEKLTELPDNEYRDFVAQILSSGTLPPLRLLPPGKGKIFAPLCLEHRAAEPAELLIALLNNNEMDALTLPADYVDSLNRRELKAVRKSARGKKLPVKFAEALVKATEKAAASGILPRMKRWLGSRRHKP